MSEFEAVVWWVGQEDLEHIMPEDLEFLPEWLGDQVRSIGGRNGRGRLWMSPRFKEFTVNFDDASPSMSVACSNRAGIVICRSDLPYLARLPGLITDSNLNRV